MPEVFLGLGTNIDRQRSMRGGLIALEGLAPDLIASPMYESAAQGFEGAPFYNCVARLSTELPLAELVAALKHIEDANGRNRTQQAVGSKGLDIDLLTYGDWVGCFDGVELPRADITRYAHVLLPLCDLAPDACLPGTTQSYSALWRAFDRREQQLERVTF